MISILLHVSAVLARACSLRAQLLKSALGRNLWELTREIIYPQPEGDTGFASALRKTLRVPRKDHTGVLTNWAGAGANPVPENVP